MTGPLCYNFGKSVLNKKCSPILKTWFYKDYKARYLKFQNLCIMCVFIYWKQISKVLFLTVLCWTNKCSILKTRFYKDDKNQISKISKFANEEWQFLCIMCVFMYLLKTNLEMTNDSLFMYYVCILFICWKQIS